MGTYVDIAGGTTPMNEWLVAAPLCSWLLALRAKIAGPPGDLDRLDRATALGALVFYAAVRSQIVVRDLFRVGAMLAGNTQHFLHRVVDAFERIVVQVAQLCARMDARLEEDLVRIDVADAGHDVLVHESGLDHAAMFAQYPAKA